MQYHDQRPANIFKQEAYAAYAKDSEVRFSGSSGGMFGVFAHQLLKQEFVIYGAAFDENMQLRCTEARDGKSLAPLMKSKYLQSCAEEKYIEIETRLKNGDKVLFVSTPCQVAALKSMLSKDYRNLITVDFFCHGVPSQLFFDKCIAIDSKRLGGKICSYQFRAKKKDGVTPHYFSVELENGGKQKTASKIYYKSAFYAIFQKYINLRESCYDCRFAGANRISDITIGDFHEIDRYVSGINRFDGVSTVIINSEKGKELWENCAAQLVVYPMELDKLIADGICFAGGTQRPANRDKFIFDYINKPFEELIHKYANPKQYFKQGIYYSMPRAIRRRLKKYIGA